MRILDRYLLREILGPFALALTLFTFLVSVNPMLERAELLLAKGVPMSTIGFLLLNLLPSSLGITIPMAFLAAVVMALGRFSGDRESVALLACGVSPVRLLRPVGLFATVTAAATFYTLIWAIPDANQTFREIVFRLTEQMAAEDIQPRLFYEGFPGKVILVGDTVSGGGWIDVLVADTSQPGRPAVRLADRGRLLVDPARRLVNINTEVVSGYRPGAGTGEYEVERFGSDVTQINPDVVFPATQGPNREANEMTLAELDSTIALKRSKGISPHPEIMSKHQRFSFPLACFVFAIIGLALGIHTRKEGKLAGFVLGIGVILVYYALMELFQGKAKAGTFPAVWARWVPNIVLGLAGVLLLWWRTKASARQIRVTLPRWLSFRLPRATIKGIRATPADGRSGSRVVVVVRVPDTPIPRPRLLDLYVGGRYLRIVTLAFFGLLALYYIGEFIELSEKLSKGQATTAMLAQYFYYATPKFIYFVVPIATLVGVLTTLGGLTKTNELTILRACGISLYRTALPLLVLALVWSGALFLLEDRLLAHSQRYAEALKDKIRDRPQRTFNVANRNWLAGQDGRLYYYALYDVHQRTLHALSVFETAKSPYRLTRHTFATRATFRDGAWHAEDGWVQTFRDAGPPARSAFASKSIELAAPEDFGTEQLDAALMSLSELREYINRLDQSGFSVASHKVEMHRKVAFPFVTLVMTLIAVPFAVTTGRRGALYGIGVAIMLAVAYLLVTAVFLAFGSAALLPAALAAWATNILFATAAAWLVLTVRT